MERDGSDQNVRMDVRRYVMNGVEVNLIPANVIVEEIDTWKGADGGARALKEEEKEVLVMLRKVCDDGECPEDEGSPKEEVDEGGSYD